MIALIILLNFTPIHEIFYLQGSKCSNVQRSKLVPEKNVPSWHNAKKLQKKLTMVMSIMFIVFIVSWLQENIKQAIATHFLLLQKKTYKKTKRITSKLTRRFFLLARRCLKSYQCLSYKKEIKNFNPKNMHRFILYNKT